jgi:hypothetical protein
MPSPRSLRPVRFAAPLLAVLALHAVPAGADLAARVAAGQQQAGQLRARIARESGAIAGYEGTLTDLRRRLAVIGRALAVQQRELVLVEIALTAARNRLHLLRGDLARDRQVLADELVAEYETPDPSVVGVIVDAHGWDDLLNRLAYLRSIERRNLAAMRVVRLVHRQVAAQTAVLAGQEARRARATAAVLSERDQVAQLKLAIVRRELPIAQARSRDVARLLALRAALAREAAQLDRQAAAADGGAFSGGVVAAPAGCVNTSFVPHGGSYGFFPAGGTDYSVGAEPVLAARLDALGRALGLHLIGISGYRTPQHSVDVGGFADDPHTRGLASDTPGVEGVPEATLERFCLTRPFGGAREADHIQEL